LNPPFLFTFKQAFDTLIFDRIFFAALNCESAEITAQFEVCF